MTNIEYFMNEEYERGFKDGMKSKIGEELQPMIVQVLEGVSEAIKGIPPLMIDNMEIKASLDANDWIPCSERLPENRYEVLCYSRDAKGHEEIFVDTYYAPDDPYYNLPSSMKNGLAEGTVTHWMPLPEPPKGGASDA